MVWTCGEVGEGDIVRRVLNMPVGGRRSRGRQRLRWMDVVGRDMREVGVGRNDAQTRNIWRRKTRAADPIVVWD